MDRYSIVTARMVSNDLQLVRLWHWKGDEGEFDVHRVC